MTRKTMNSAARRPGFTLVELLVVIAIIAVLVSLTAAAVINVLRTGPDVQVHVEIGQLTNAIGAATSDFNNVEYLPSVIFLREDGAYGTGGTYGTTTVTPAMELASLAYLQKAFSKNIGVGTTIDWNGDGMIASGQVWVLDGGQCLVFWLGGIPDNLGGSGMRGFNANSSNPGGTGGGAFKQPYFAFRPDRLIQGPALPGATGTALNFPYYRDPYNPGMPYAYFSYNPKLSSYNDTDCTVNGTFPLFPYKLSLTGPYINPKGFQIISAGKDCAFGLGGVWNPATGYGPGQVGSDDIANFSQAVLGAPLN
jgi:general secretion pathway protein G